MSNPAELATFVHVTVLPVLKPVGAVVVQDGAGNVIPDSVVNEITK